MNLDEVIDQRTLGGYVATLLPRADRLGRDDRTLETYLRALLEGVLRSRDEPPSFRLFAELLERALDDEAPGDEPPHDPTMLESLAANTATDWYDRLLRLLATQIIDLRQMQAAGTLDLPAADLWWGQDSPGGRRWYNFTIWSYLEPTARHWDNGDPDTDDDDDEVSWLDFSFVVSDGQYYE